MKHGCVIGFITLISLQLFWHANADLPQGMVGYWQGSPTVSPLGPWGSYLFNFSIVAIDNNPSQWLMSDEFTLDSVFVPDSFQQFWVQEDQGVAYCGLVRNFFGVPAPVFVNLTQTLLTNTQIQWCLGSCSSSSWTLTLANENTLISHFLYDSPINHANITMNRVPNVDRKLLRLPSFPQPPPCNLSLTQVPTLMRSEDVESPLKLTRCPHAAKLLKSKSGTESAPKIKLPKELSQKYQYCYILNPALEFALMWNFSEELSEIQVAISMPTPNPQTTWLV